jgi:simple sugar transport system substrate-binding protein/ribose transport system substrate-binding protein
MLRIRRPLWLALLAAGLLSLLCVGGCTDGGQPEEDEVTFLIGMSQANLGEPWRVVMNDEIRAAAAKYPNLRVIFTDAAQDSQKQIRDVENLLGYGIDLLMISPNEAEPLTPIVEKAYRSIPVIVIDREIEGDGYTMFIGADNREIGKMAGEFVAGLLGAPGGQVIEVLGLPGSVPAQHRSEGFREALAGYPSIRIVDTVVADWLRDKAEDEMLPALSRNPDVDVVYAHNDPMALGASRAAANLHMEGLRFIGIDGLPGSDGGAQLVAQGVLQATFVYPTGGAEAIEYAVKLLERAGEVPKRLTLESRIIAR